jgi:hypothetical protein
MQRFIRMTAVRRPAALRQYIGYVMGETRSDERFTVDGTLTEAAAGLKSFKAKHQPPSDDPGNPTVDLRGEKGTVKLTLECRSGR